MSTLKKFCCISIFAFLSITATVSLAADVDAGKEKSMLCSACHGADGISLTPDIPNLASQKKAYLIKATKDFRNGSRKNPMMNSIAQGLSDDDIANLAAYFSSL
ncbi:MAG: cytochrome c [Gammaproteobacteria bacterium]|nr:cytochrome c [Gammaproteobacteria bacterium]